MIILRVIGSLLRDRAAQHRACQWHAPAGCLRHEEHKVLADAYEKAAEWFDHREEERRIYRLVCLYPVPWATARRILRAHGDKADAYIEGMLSGGLAP